MVISNRATKRNPSERGLCKSACSCNLNIPLGQVPKLKEGIGNCRSIIIATHHNTNHCVLANSSAIGIALKGSINKLNQGNLDTLTAQTL